MELTRRDALAALAASGAAVGAGAVLEGNPFAGAPDSADADGTSPADRMDSLLAVAEVVYPSEVSGVEEFVRTYVLGRTRAGGGQNSERREATREDPTAYRDAMVSALGTLDDYARTWHDADFRALDAETRRTVLDQMGVDTADPDPEGTEAERVRYYLVNELLYALYTSPTGGKLVGIENPQGHPGGTGSYRRGPNE